MLNRGSKVFAKSAMVCTVLSLCLGSNCQTVSTGGGALQGQPGTSFASAGLLALTDGEDLVVSGTIVGAEVDVFDLGAVSPGDRVIVSVNAANGSQLDPTLALFDESEELFALNDDVDLAGGNFNSAVDDIITKAGARFFVAVTKFFLDQSGGAYEVTVRIERGGQVPTPPAQTLLLNFAGGQVTIESEGDFNLDPFDSGDIDDAYDGETAAIKQRIKEVVEENFTGTGVTIVSSDDNPVLQAGTFSTIHFGAFSSTKFGVADAVDVGNMDRCDDGIVFTEGFDDPFAQQPSADGIATAIANVAAHEAGHLFGLNHVADVTALMDNTGTASTLLANQDFKTAGLSPSVFPFGNQNANSLLERVLPAP